MAGRLRTLTDVAGQPSSQALPIESSSDRGTHSRSSSEKLHVFISYSRVDLDFADQLLIGMELAGFAPSIDRDSISGGEDWRQRLGNLIRETDTVVFVLSPASAASEICAWEVSEAARLGQRIIPVVCRPLEEKAVPQRLGDLNYIYFYSEPKQPGSGFAAGLKQLAAALNTDIEWHREHTRILVRATEWDQGGRQADRLLSGADIRAAKEWAGRRPQTATELTELQLAFIRASEEEAEARSNAERRRLAEVAAAQDARAKALADAEAALKQASEAQRRRALLRNVLLVVMTLAACLSGWSWFTISEGNKELAKQVRIAQEAASRARSAQQRAQDSEFDAIVNECTASQQLLRAEPKEAENLHNYMSCGVRFAFALIRREQPEDATIFLSRVRHTRAQSGLPQGEQVGAFFLLLISQAEAVAECAAARAGTPARTNGIRNLIGASSALVEFQPPRDLEQRWREEMLRGYFYLSNFSQASGDHEQAFQYAALLVARLSKLPRENADGARDFARALDNLAWAALMTKRFGDASRASQQAVQIVDEHRISDFTSVKLNRAHTLLFAGQVQDARRLYQELNAEDIADDVIKLVAVGLCRNLFSELIGARGRCTTPN